MAKGRRKRIIQSLDEYMTEEHIRQGSSQNNDAASDLYPSTGGDPLGGEADIEGNAQATEFYPSTGADYVGSDKDIEVNVQDETEEIAKRGKTKLKDVWNLPRGHRIVVRCNELDQPIGEEAGVLGKFLGMVARNGCLCSLGYKDWRLLIGKKERNTNEQKNKNDILKQVKMRFLYPARMEKWLLRTIGERWRQHKSNLKSIHFDVHKSKEANYSNGPQGVVADQWIALVNNWMTHKAQDISETNRINCSKKKSTHTAGTKSFARNREDLKDKDPHKKYPHRAVLYIHTHQSNREKNTNAHVGDLKELLAQQPDLADTSQGKDAWKGDALNKILGDEKHGHVHGLGLVPNPNKVFDHPTSRHLKHLHLTSLDATSSEDIVSLRLQVEKLGHLVQNQDATIQELQHKTRSLEQKQQPQGCIDDHLSTSRDGFCADGPNSKRKRLYADPKRQEFSMAEELNDTVREQSDGDEYRYLQPHYKYYHIADKRKPPNVQGETLKQANRVSASLKAKPNQTHSDIISDKSNCTAAAKVMDQEITTNSSNHDSSKYQKYQHGRTNCSAENSLVGTKVFLMSLKNQRKSVALATVLSCDPTQKLEGVPLGKQFWMVRVSFTIKDDEPLIRPCKNFKVIGDVDENPIAWPSTFIERIN